MKPGTEIHDNVLGTERIETLSDGIFAIVMTLLVLEMHVPELGAVHSSTDLSQALLALAPKFVAFILSFVILGIFWIGHHLQFYYIKHSNRTLLWINIIFHMTISLIPFSAALLGNYHREQIAVVIYAVNLILAGLLILIQWVYATNKRRLVHDDINPDLVRTGTMYMLAAPFLYGAGIILSFWSTFATLVLFGLLPLRYIIPSKLDQYLPGYGSGHRLGVLKALFRRS